MSLYVLKVWVGDEPRDLVIDEVIEADDDASAIDAARKYPVPLWVGLAAKAELRNFLSLPIWSLPPTV